MCIYHILYLLSLTYRLEVTLREQCSLDKSDVKLQWGWRRPTWIQFWHQLIWNWPSMSGQCMFQTKEKTRQSTLLGMSSACRAQWLSNKGRIGGFCKYINWAIWKHLPIGLPRLPPTGAGTTGICGTCTTPPKWIYQDHREKFLPTEAMGSLQILGSKGRLEETKGRVPNPTGDVCCLPKNDEIWIDVVLFIINPWLEKHASLKNVGPEKGANSQISYCNQSSFACRNLSKVLRYTGDARSTQRLLKVFLQLSHIPKQQRKINPSALGAWLRTYTGCWETIGWNRHILLQQIHAIWGNWVKLLGI